MVENDINYLPKITSVSPNIRLGRSVYEGYQRGWGLQFGKLLEDVKNDPLYNQASSLINGRRGEHPILANPSSKLTKILGFQSIIESAMGKNKNGMLPSRSVQTEINRINIFLIIKFYLNKIDFGHIIEFGSYLGGSAIFMSYLVSKLYPGMKVYALDTFEGMPETDKSVDAHSKGDFQSVDLDELQDYVRSLGLTNLEFVKGRFEDTAISVLNTAQKISLAHIDCDIYSSVKYSYLTVKNYMVHGGYIVFDDPLFSSCIGAQEAVEKYVIRKDGLYAEQIYPQYVFRYPAL